MIHVAVYGDLKYSTWMKELLEKEYSELVVRNGGEAIKVDYFVSLTKTQNQNEISIAEFAGKYMAGELVAVVIPKEYFLQHNSIVNALLKNGVEPDDIYCGIRLDDKVGSNEEALEALITPILSDSYLSYLEFHVADHCNLNCKLCTHYSPLVKEPVFTDFEAFKKDLTQLKKYIYDMGVIRILGGEPLLCDELPKFIRLVRSLYPASIIYVVTNGLLIEKISDELINAMKECIAFFHISYYKPLEGKIKEIESFLYGKGIAYTVSPLNEVFGKSQTLIKQDNEDFFYSCFQSSCTCLHEGKVAPCYTPFMTKYFNEAFSDELSEKLPTDEGIDLYEEDLSLPLLKARLLIPMERCKYCFEGETESWSVIGKNSRLEDWVHV